LPIKIICKGKVSIGGYKNWLDFLFLILKVKPTELADGFDVLLGKRRVWKTSNIMA
jgi:hypothetical protein